MSTDVGFVPLVIADGLLADLGKAHVYGWREASLSLTGDATHFGMVTVGQAEVTDAHGAIRLAAGMYFVIPGDCQVLPVAGTGLVVAYHGYRGLRQFGGPVSGEGRLRYIDGCSDTLLAGPARRGEPCLNYLHVPPYTRQSTHTHPSERTGVVLRGRGACHTPGAVHPLRPGMGWRIPAHAHHAFVTDTEPLEILAWHPDSDYGPTDEDHPMLNRTLRPT